MHMTSKVVVRILWGGFIWGGILPQMPFLRPVLFVNAKSGKARKAEPRV